MEEQITKDLNRMKPEIKFVLSTLPVYMILLAFFTHLDFMMDWMVVNRFYVLSVMGTFFMAGRLVRDLK